MSVAAPSDPVPQVSSRRLPVAVPLILLLTAAVILLWGHFKLLDQDEVFVLQTDSVGSLGQLIDIQRHYPISLDPLFYHLLGHIGTKLFGVGAFAVRLPSLLGYLLMQVCLFFIARRIAGERAGIVAAAVPALTATLYYGVEARPYGVLLGLAALVLLSWQRATRPVEGSRTGALLTLAISLALALNTHYFAILLLIPLCAAELFRMWSNRRIDWPVVIAIVAGMAGVVFTLPFQKGAGEFRKHYYNAGRIGLHAITQAYRALFVAYTDYSMAVQHALMAVLVIGAALLLWALWQRFRTGGISLPPAERVFLIVLAALPFFGFLLARFVTHSIEVRYVLCAILALAVLIALAALPLLRSERAYRTVVAGLLVCICLSGLERLREERAKREERLASLALPDALKARLLATPDARLYVQNMGSFDEHGTYLTDPALRNRMTLVFSRDEELRWSKHDTVSLTAMHMQHFTGFTIVPYEQLRTETGEHLMVIYHSGWDWTDGALREDAASITPMGHFMDGDLVAVIFRTAK